MEPILFSDLSKDLGILVKDYGRICIYATFQFNEDSDFHHLAKYTITINGKKIQYFTSLSEAFTEVTELL